MHFCLCLFAVFFFSFSAATLVSDIQYGKQLVKSGTLSVFYLFFFFLDDTGARKFVVLIFRRDVFFAVLPVLVFVFLNSPLASVTILTRAGSENNNMLFFLVS